MRLGFLITIVLTALRSQLVKGNDKANLYRDYNSFDIKLLKEDLDKNLKSNNTVNLSDFQNTFTTVLHKHAPIKKKILRFNNNPDMSKVLRKAIMHRSKLKNIYNKNRTDVNWANYKKQRNFCVKLLRRTKKEYFQNLNVKGLSDNKTFWKTIKPYFSKKGLNSNKMLLKEKGEFVSDEKQLVSIMNKLLINITKSLKLKEDLGSSPVTLNDTLEKFILIPSTDKITKTYENDKKFSFQQVTEEQVRQVTLSIDGSKATPVGDIPADRLKVTLDIHLSLITKIINLSFENGCFPDDLKPAEVSPIFKRNDDLDKESYRPVSILFNVSNVFERIIYSQISAFMQDKLSKLLTGFRKNLNTQHCLMYMLENWKNMLDKGGYVCAMFMDLSKAFDTIHHDLMIAKLGAYGFSQDALQYTRSYLTNTQQRVRVNSNFSTWEDIIAGVPQGSLLFNIFINDLFLFVSNLYLSNYADNNTLHAFGYNLEETKNTLCFDFDVVSKSFEENYMVLNADKYHFMCLGKDTESETFIFNNSIFNNSNEKKILWITIDHKLTFKGHFKILCRKAAQKMGALSRLLNHLSDSQK